MLDPDDLGPADKALLELLREGRVIAPYAAEETDYSLQYVRDRLGRFVEHGNVRKVYDGLYELVEDPMDSEPAQRREEPPQPEPEQPDSRSADPLRDDMERVLADLDVPGRADAVEATRREAIRWAWDYLRRHDGAMSGKELAGAVQDEFGDNPDFNYGGEARYHGYQFWDNCGREKIRELPGVVEGGDGWRIDE